MPKPKQKSKPRGWVLAADAGPGPPEPPASRGCPGARWRRHGVLERREQARVGTASWSAERRPPGLGHGTLFAAPMPRQGAYQGPQAARPKP
eukprot:13561193-Alexandrium_andersonii.AAC.1